MKEKFQFCNKFQNSLQIHNNFRLSSLYSLKNSGCGDVEIRLNELTVPDCFFLFAHRWGGTRHNQQQNKVGGFCSNCLAVVPHKFAWFLACCSCCSGSSLCSCYFVFAVVIVVPDILFFLQVSCCFGPVALLFCFCSCPCCSWYLVVPPGILFLRSYYFLLLV